MAGWQSLCTRLFKRFVLVTLLGGAFSASAFAASVQFVGAVGWSGDWATFAILTADNIHNYDSSGISGALRLELWASAQPFSDFSSGYRLSKYDVPPLAAGASTGQITAIVPFTPRAGVWYVAMVLTEFTGAATDDGYTLRNVLRFPGVIYTGGPPPPPPDTTPPTVSITSPTGGNVSGTVTVSANASDNVGVARVDFYVNGSLVSSDSAAPYQYSWNTTSVANGTATLRAIAYDAAGNSGQSSLVSVTVANGPPPDTTPPTVRIVSPAAGKVAGSITITADASDNVGVVRVDFYVNGSLIATDYAPPWQASWSTTKAADKSINVFAVAYDAAGNSGTSATVQMEAINPGGPPPGSPSTQTTAYAVEYYNAALDHYFMTALQSDIDVLDSGAIAGWVRTGYSFKVYAQAIDSASPVCRIYIPPARGDSHFFSASPAECAEAMEQNPDFVFETADAFYIDTPDESGNCPAGDAPIYRLWNHRADINHRYTTSWDVRQQMVAQGYVPEGYGPNAVMMCSPP